MAVRSSYAFGAGGLVESKALILVTCCGPLFTLPPRCASTLVGTAVRLSPMHWGDSHWRVTCFLTPVFCAWASFLATERDTTVYLIFSLAACYCTNVVTLYSLSEIPIRTLQP